MMVFRDKQFCQSDCVNTQCHRRWNDELQASAVRWWAGSKGEPPIDRADLSIGCADYQPPRKGK